MKVKTGEVLACASYPTYDLSTYNTNYNELAADFNDTLAGFPAGLLGSLTGIRALPLF